MTARNRGERPSNRSKKEFPTGGDRTIPWSLPNPATSVDPADFFALVRSQKLVGQGGVEPVPASIGVMALVVIGRLVLEVGRVCHHIRSRRLSAGRVVRI
jgi:hypothetical protein